MTTLSTLDKPLPTSAKIFFQLQLPGVPWYVYHDRFDAYIVHSETNVSVVVFDLSLDPATKQNLIIGGTKIPLPGTNGPINTEWTRLDRLRGWHHSPGHIKDFVCVVGQRHPSINYRSVVADVQYKIQTLPAGSHHFQVRVTSLIGEGQIDGNTEDGRNQVPQGQGVFELTIKRTHDGGDGWNLIGTQGIEVQDSAITVDW